MTADMPPETLGRAEDFFDAKPIVISEASKPTVPHEINKAMVWRFPRCGSTWRRFIPALIVYPMWLYSMSKQETFAGSFGTYYPLSIAMIAGSMIAGSTPLGGGVVAFPVAVLVIKFKPDEGRDFALIIQSVGMTAASFLILYAKRDLCHTWLILWFTMSSMIGLICGFEIAVSPFVVNVTFTTAVVCFALAFAYRNCIARPPSQTSSQSAAVAVDDAWDLLRPGRFDLTEVFLYRIFGQYFPLALTLCACLFGFLGGLLTSKLGSGADMLAFIFGAFVWNSSVPVGARLSTNTLTASSVLIMAAISIIGTILRELQSGGISREVKLCWGACVPIVVLGAPIGSLLLTPALSEMLRRCFYVLSIVQLACFGTLKIKGNLPAWIGVISAIASVSLLLALHYVFIVRAAHKPKVPQEEDETTPGPVISC